MTNALDFTFSDLIAGYITGYDPNADLVELRKRSLIRGKRVTAESSIGCGRALVDVLDHGVRRYGW